MAGHPASPPGELHSSSPPTPRLHSLSSHHETARLAGPGETRPMEHTSTCPPRCPYGRPPPPRLSAPYVLQTRRTQGPPSTRFHQGKLCSILMHLSLSSTRVCISISKSFTSHRQVLAGREELRPCCRFQREEQPHLQEGGAGLGLGCPLYTQVNGVITK